MSDPPARPHRASAVVVLIRGEAPRLEAFWARRSDEVSFMPGFRSFVGGVVDPADEELPIEGAEGQDRTERACALREAFEEAGVLAGVEQAGDPGTLAAARTRLLAGEATFPELARAHGWRFHARALTRIGRWITPPFAPRRFETPYFLARVPAGQEPVVHPGELVDGEWIAPVEALRRWQQGHEAFAAPILYTLLGLAHGEDGLAERLAEAPEAAGQPARRIEVQWGFVLVPLHTRPLPPATHTNAYLVGEPEMVLVDPGSDDPAALEELFAVVDALVQDRRRLKMIVLTHHHLDHVAGAAAACARYRVPLAAHAETAKHVHVDVTLADGERIPLLPGAGGDWTLEVLHTPGHAPGHLCLFHRRTGALLTGDQVPGGTGTVIIDPPDGDMAAYLRSLERLAALPVKTLFPGHGGPQGAALRRIRKLIEHRLGREARVFAALGPEPRGLAELVEFAYADTPRELWPYAERSLLAHLIKLESEGRVQRAGASWRAA